MHPSLIYFTSHSFCSLFKGVGLRVLLVLIVFLTNLATSLAKSETAPLKATYISFSYEDNTVREVVKDLRRRYDLAFSYSSNEKLLSVKITARSGLVALSEGLEIIFAGTPIEYRIISEHIAFRYSSRLEEELLSANTSAEKPKIAPAPKRRKPARKVNTLFGRKRKETDEVAKVVETPPPPPEPEIKREVRAPAAAIPREETTEIAWKSSPVTSDRKVLTERKKRRKLARFSIFPGLSTGRLEEGNAIHTLSINMPVGLSGGLSGAELGVAFNGIKGNMEGVQICGGVNAVDEQITGAQIAGIGNGAGIGTGLQIAGGFNYCRRTLQGTQISGLLNVALNGVNRQYSVGLNLVQGDVKRQVGLVNRAVDVSRGQIGLVNLSDTIAGRSFGLINFVRKGYNTLEIARTSIVPYQFAWKMGSYRFYNVFEFGGGRRDLKLIGTEERREQIVWSLGYGFGWMNRLGKSPEWRANTEIVGTHLMRGVNFQKRLNFIASIRWTIDWKPGGFTNFFIGPVMNFHWTEFSDDELDKLFVSGWKLWDKRYDKTAFRGVLGVRFGLRLGKK